MFSPKSFKSKPKPPELSPDLVPFPPLRSDVGNSIDDTLSVGTVSTHYTEILDIYDDYDLDSALQKFESKKDATSDAEYPDSEEEEEELDFLTNYVENIPPPPSNPDTTVYEGMEHLSQLENMFLSRTQQPGKKSLPNSRTSLYHNKSIKRVCRVPKTPLHHAESTIFPSNHHDQEFVKFPEEEETCKEITPPYLQGNTFIGKSCIEKEY